jgi:hypothetical protein
MVNGDAIQKGLFCKEIVVLFFGTADHIRDDCENRSQDGFARPRLSESMSPGQGGADPLSTTRRPVIQRE